MKKWGKPASALIVLALVIWAGSRFSTAMVRLLSLFDEGDGLGETVFIEQIEDVPTIAPEVWAPSDQDYDAVQGVAEAVEDVKPRSTDYLNDGDEMHRVDKTAEELAAEERE